MSALITDRRRERVEHLARRALAGVLDADCDRVAAVDELAATALDSADVRDAIQVLLDEVRHSGERERAMWLLSNVLGAVETRRGSPDGA